MQLRRRSANEQRGRESRGRNALRSRRDDYRFGALLPRPPPDGLPVVLGKLAAFPPLETGPLPPLLEPPFAPPRAPPPPFAPADAPLLCLRQTSRSLRSEFQAGALVGWSGHPLAKP
jgi:hypothetical protein